MESMRQQASSGDRASRLVVRQVIVAAAAAAATTQYGHKSASLTGRAGRGVEELLGGTRGSQEQREESSSAGLDLIFSLLLDSLWLFFCFFPS